MISISPLQNVFEEGSFGNVEGKSENEIIKIREIKNIFIYQIVKYKNSEKKNIDLKIDGLNFPENLKVNSNSKIRILWMGPNNWLIVSSIDLNKIMEKDFLSNDFAVTNISHSRSIIELEGKNVNEVIKKGSPFNIDEMELNTCSNTIFNGITITVDNINTNPNLIRILSLRSFGETLYYSITDACLEFGYKSG